MAQSSLPLIPYPTSGEREIILRRGSSIVLYDHEEKKLLLHSTDLEKPVCPTCHRPYDDDTEDKGPSDSQWMSPDYFRLLHEASVQTSRAQSPQRLLPGRTASAANSAKDSPYRTSVADGNESAGDEASADASHQRISPSAFSPGYFKQHFVEIRELGRGGSGVVLQVKHVLEGENLGELACKRIPIGDDLPWLTKVLAEVKLLQRLRHPNLVAYQHVWLEHFKPSVFAPSVPHAFILQQFCNSGDLQSYLFATIRDTDGNTVSPTLRPLTLTDETSARPLPFDQIRDFFKDITAGLRFLHSEGFVHRDLKPSNCLLHRNGKRTTALVSDFGETTEENAIRKSSGATGTVSYCAPEVLKTDLRTGRFGNFTQKSDIFSLGLIVHLMCYGKLPFVNANPRHEENENYDKLREEIATWKGLSHERGVNRDVIDRLRDDLNRLLSLKPDERPSAEDILHVLKTNPYINDSSARAPSASRRGSVVLEKPDRPDYRTPAVEDEPTSPNTAFFDESSIDSSRNEKGPRPRPSLKITSLVRRRYVRPSSQDRELTPQRPLLLLAPPKSWKATLSEFQQSPVFATSAKLIVFGMKMWTVITPCRPLAVQLSAALPLLSLAALELSGLLRGTGAAVVLAIIHVVVLGLLSRGRLLCDEN